MNNDINYIPREYLALKINYCRTNLSGLPVINMRDYKINNSIVKCIRINGKIRRVSKPSNQKYLALAQERETLLDSLNMLTAQWNKFFKGDVPYYITPHQITRSFISSGYNTIINNREFFDSLESNSNNYYIQNKTNEYNGVYYRSKEEKEIAKFYTAHGIEFKYEPKIVVNNCIRYPDFVIWISELGICLIHEHYGMMSSGNYKKDMLIKNSDYIQSGLIPGKDIIASYSEGNVKFDTNLLLETINLAIMQLLS